jgi:hypothetical protein
VATIRELSEEIAAACTPVPPVGAGICKWCHNAPATGYDACYSCWTVRQQVTHPARVVPISLMTRDGPLYGTLKGYKSSRDRIRKQTFRLRVVGLVARFLIDHERCIDPSRDGWDFVTSVPSTRPERLKHPLSAALDLYAPLGNRDVLARGTGQLDRNVASDDAFVAVTNIAGQRCVLVDDTYVTGAKAQSAASALALAGATVLAIVPAGRLINPNFSAETHDYWEARKTDVFDFGACCLCA